MKGGAAVLHRLDVDVLHAEKIGQRIEDEGFIVDEEDAAEDGVGAIDWRQLKRRIAGEGEAGCFGTEGQGQFEAEGGAVRGTAFDGEIAAVGLGDGAGDG